MPSEQDKRQADEVYLQIGHRAITQDDGKTCGEIVREEISLALSKARKDGRNEACDTFIRITENDTNKIVADHCGRVAEAVRNLK